MKARTLKKPLQCPRRGPTFQAIKYGKVEKLNFLLQEAVGSSKRTVTRPPPCEVFQAPPTTLTLQREAASPCQLTRGYNDFTTAGHTHRDLMSGRERPNPTCTSSIPADRPITGLERKQSKPYTFQTAASMGAIPLACRNDHLHAINTRTHRKCENPKCHVNSKYTRVAPIALPIPSICTST